MVNLGGEFFHAFSAVEEVPMHRPGIELEPIEWTDDRFALRGNCWVCSMQRVTVVEGQDILVTTLATHLVEVRFDSGETSGDFMADSSRSSKQFPVFVKVSVRVVDLEDR